jgi:hypothetical protein
LLIIICFKEALVAVFPNLIPALVMNFASAKSETRSATMIAFDSLLSNTEPASLIQHLSQAILASNNKKIQVILLEKLNQIVGEVCSKKPTLIIKYVLPVVVQLLDNNSHNEIKRGNIELARTLYQYLGDMLFQNGLTESQKSRLTEIL